MARYQELYDPIRAYALACWINDETPTLNGAARACGEIRMTGGAETYSTPIRTAYQRLERDGIIMVANRTEQSRIEWPIIGFNWTGKPASGQTLADAIGPYLADHSVARASRQLLKEATREVLEGLVPTSPVGTRTDEALLVAASQLPAELIRLLPKRALALPVAKRHELARALRNMMRHAVDNDSVVIYTHPPRALSPWQASIDRVIPRPPIGRLSPRDLSRRTWLSRLRTTLEEIGGTSVADTIDLLTAVEVNMALDHIETIDANARAAREIRAVLIGLGELGEGPYRALATARTYVSRLTDRHYGASYTLIPADGTPMQASWENMIHTLRSHGINDNDIRFIRFLADYTDMDGEDLERVYGHKLVRPGIRHLRGLSFKARIQALRAYYGIAVTDLKWPAGEVTIRNLFGHRFQEVTLRLRELWRKRAAAATELAALGVPVRGFPGSADAHTLERIIINGGLVAATALEHSRWRRGLEGLRPEVNDAGEEKPIRVDGLTVAGLTHLTDDEEAWATAYRYANAKAEEIEEARGQGRRTHRDVGAVIEDVPTMALIPSYLEQLQDRVKRSPHSPQVMIEAVHAMARGIIATGGARVGELPKVRLGHEFRPDKGDRHINLEPKIRKAAVEHVLVIHRELVPDWLYRYVLDVARPALVRIWLEKQGTGASDHQYLFVGHNGAPLAKHDWTFGMTTLTPQALGGASSRLTTAFADWRRQQLKAQGYRVVKGAWGHHTTHTARHQMNQAGIACGFTEMQMTLLLGHKGRSMGQVAYTTAVAREIDRIITEILRRKPWRDGYADIVTTIASLPTRGPAHRSSPATSAAPESVRGLLALKAQVDAGEITAKQLLAAMAGLDD